VSNRAPFGRVSPLPLARFSGLVREAEAVGLALEVSRLPEALGELRRVEARLTARLYSQPAPPPGNAADRLLTAEETADRLSISTDTVYRNAAAYPFTVRQGRALRFSSQGVDAYIRSRQGNPAQEQSKQRLAEINQAEATARASNSVDPPRQKSKKRGPPWTRFHNARHLDSLSLRLYS